LSLRDAFLAKGLVSKKDADRVARELRDERKAAQGQRKSKGELEREEKAREEAARAARLEQAAADRKAHAEALARHEREHRIRQIVTSNRLAGRGPVPYAFRKPDGRVGQLWLKEAIARDLRNGNAAIAIARVDGAQPGHIVITAAAATKLEEIGADVVLHWVREPGHLGDPSESLMLRTWESGGLGPHRVHDPAELAARVAAERARRIGPAAEVRAPVGGMASRASGAPRGSTSARERPIYRDPRLFK
jgi:uncharacterized protein YaiL (DUF2058 family)